MCWLDLAAVPQGAVGGAVGSLPLGQQQRLSGFVRQRHRGDCNSPRVSETSQPSGQRSTSENSPLMVEGAGLSKWEGAEWVEFRLEEEGLACRTHDNVHVHTSVCDCTFTGPPLDMSTPPQATPPPEPKPRRPREGEAADIQSWKRAELLTCIR